MRKCSRQVSGDNSNQSFPGVESYQDVTLNLANEWHCTPMISFVRSPGRATGTVGGKLTSLPSNREWQMVKCVQCLIGSWQARGRIGSSFRQPSMKTDGFRRFADKFPLATGEEAMHLRLWFHSAWMKYSALKEAADKALSALIGAGKEDAFSRILVSISEVQSEVGLGDDFDEAR